MAPNSAERPPTAGNAGQQQASPPPSTGNNTSSAQSTAPNHNTTNSVPKVTGNAPSSNLTRGPVQMTILEPILKDAKGGNKISAANRGEAVVLLTTLGNNDQNDTRVLTVMEARRVSDGVTYYLGWREDSLRANSTLQVQFSWVPDTPGEYQFRTFAISGLENPRILTGITTSDATVSNK